MANASNHRRLLGADHDGHHSLEFIGPLLIGERTQAGLYNSSHAITGILMVVSG